MSRLTTASRIRRFNRFYTRRMGLLHPGLLHSRFSLTEVRVLYEIAHQSRPTAKTIAQTLWLDPGYLSRILRGFRQRGLISARAESHDRRERRLTLTSRGRRTFGVLNARATDQVADMLQGLSSKEQEQLLRSLDTVETMLDDGQAAPVRSPAIELRAPQPGDLGWVVQRHGELYEDEYGWNADFERLVARIVGEFAAADDPRQRCWIATLDGVRAGCVFLVPTSARIAKLRLLLVEPWARGHGLGTRLVEACVEAARGRGYRTLTLWTNHVLVDARRLYERAGFRLVQEERHYSFGKSLVGQNWELKL